MWHRNVTYVETLVGALCGHSNYTFHYNMLYRHSDIHVDGNQVTLYFPLTRESISIHSNKKQNKHSVTKYRKMYNYDIYLHAVVKDIIN